MPLVVTLGVGFLIVGAKLDFSRDFCQQIYFILYHAMGNSSSKYVTLQAESTSLIAGSTVTGFILVSVPENIQSSNLLAGSSLLFIGKEDTKVEYRTSSTDSNGEIEYALNLFSIAAYKPNANFLLLQVIRTRTGTIRTPKEIL